MRIDVDFLEDPDGLEEDDETRNQRILLGFALGQLKYDTDMIKSLELTISSLRADLADIKESTCKCCHAKFGAEPVFSGEEDLPVGDGAKTTEACEGLGYKRPRGAVPTGYYW